MHSMFHAVKLPSNGGAILTEVKRRVCNLLFYIGENRRLFYDHFNNTSIKPCSRVFYPHFMHKVIHSFCG